MWPSPVFSPYTRSGPSTAASTTARASAMRARAAGPSSSRAPRATAQRFASDRGPSSMVMLEVPRAASVIERIVASRRRPSSTGPKWRGGGGGAPGGGGGGGGGQGRHPGRGPGDRHRGTTHHQGPHYVLYCSPRRPP